MPVNRRKRRQKKNRRKKFVLQKLRIVGFEVFCAKIFFQRQKRKHSVYFRMVLYARKVSFVALRKRENFYIIAKEKNRRSLRGKVKILTGGDGRNPEPANAKAPIRCESGADSESESFPKVWMIEEFICDWIAPRRV